MNDIIPLILMSDSNELSVNIKNRFKTMIDQGVVDEVRVAFKTAKVSIKSKPAFRAIGVNEIKQFIDNKIDFDDLQKLVIIKTRQYAKRQRTWFRNKFMSWKRIEFSEKTSYKRLAQDIESV
jgi:tRNA dimethylallyltransferase